jgi:hypothetical protein
MLKVDMKLKTKVGKTLQLDKKWIRLMLTLSIVAIIGLSIYPEGGMMKSKQAMESVPMQRFQRPNMPEIYINDDSTIVEEPIVSAQEPIEIKIVKEEEPFDWKEMISWVIGAINGVVLLVMNIKNIRKK